MDISTQRDGISKISHIQGVSKYVNTSKSGDQVYHNAFIYIYKKPG
jgi:hypothetical protein